MRRYQGLIMRRIIFLLLIFVSFSSFAGTSRESAYASCLFNAVPGHQICIDDGVNRIYRKVISSSTSVQTYLYYQQCTNTSQIYNEITHVCYAPPDCPSPGVLTLNTTTGYKTCTSSDVTCPDGSTAPTQAECTITCNYTPNVTTVGSIQTINWQTQTSPTSPCVNNSVSCTAPMVANIEHKRCDHQCDDGSIVDVSSGAQCPRPECKGQQTYNETTNKCDEPNCTSNGMTNDYLNPVTHNCEPEPYCMGEQTLNRLNIPHVCDDPVCTAPEVLNVTTKVCSKPPPPECKGAQYLNSDSTACIDPVCPTGFHLNADKICEFTPNCPPYSVKTMVGGVLKCADTPTNTESRTTESPTSTETTTKQNPDGTTTTTTQTPGTTSQTRTNPDGSTTTTTTVPGKTSTTDCPDCAKESTLRDIAKNLSSTTGLGNYSSVTNTTEKGNFDDSISDAQAALDENKDALTAKMAEVKTGVSSLFSDSVSGGGGSLPTIDLGNMKGVNVSQDLNKFSPELSVVGTIIIAMAWVMALSITLSR